MASHPNVPGSTSGLAPSDEVRRWFDHVLERFPAFRARYRQQLVEHSEQINVLQAGAKHGRVTILYAARDREHNNAVVLAELIHTSYGTC